MEPLREPGWPDPDRGAILIDITFGRLEHRIWGPEATQEDVAPVIDVCFGAGCGPGFEALPSRRRRALKGDQ